MASQGSCCESVVNKQLVLTTYLVTLFTDVVHRLVKWTESYMLHNTCRVITLAAVSGPVTGGRVHLNVWHLLARTALDVVQLLSQSFPRPAAHYLLSTFVILTLIVKTERVDFMSARTVYSEVRLYCQCGEGMVLSTT